MKIFWRELIISLILLVLVGTFSDPFMLLMPDSVLYMTAAALVLLFAVFSSFIWKEKARDERDELHRMIAARVGYLVGAGVLVIAIVVETFSGHVDKWLLIALAAMILAKLAGFIYGETHR